MHNIKKWAVFNIVIMAPLCQGASDIYTPALPNIAKYFSMSHTWSQLTIIIFLFFYAIGQFFWGCYSDYCGRKPALIYGMLIACVGFVVSPFAHSMGVLLLSRVIQGLGLASIGVNYKAIVIDQFDENEIYHVSSITNSAWGLGPIIAPFIGGYLTEWFHWQANFWFLLIYTVIAILLVIFTLDESLKTKLDIPFSSLMKVYKAHIVSLPLWSGILVLSAVYTQMLAFNLLAPFMVINILHYSVITYGYLALGMGLAFLVGTLINKRALRHVEPHIICFISIAVALISAVIMLFLHYADQFTLNSFYIPSLLINLTVGMIFPNCIIRTQRLFKAHHGVTTAMIGVLMILLTALSTLFISFSEPVSMFALAAWDLSMAVVVSVFYSMLFRYSRQ